MATTLPKKPKTAKAARLTRPPDPAPANYRTKLEGANKVYPCAIVGESHYQLTIRTCRVGDYVDFFREPGNPHLASGQAIAVTDLLGRTLGYIFETSWLKRVVFEEGDGIVGRIRAINDGCGYTLGVTLDVAVDWEPLNEREFTRD